MYLSCFLAHRGFLWEEALNLFFFKLILLRFSCIYGVEIRFFSYIVSSPIQARFNISSDKRHFLN